MAIQNISRRRFLTLLGITGGMLVSNPWNHVYGQADSEHCPQVAGKKIRWIVPAKAGGGLDTYSRLIKPFYEAKLGAQIVIENVPGAGTISGSKRLKEAKPDGLTLGILNVSSLFVAALTGITQAPNLATDFTILGRVARSQKVWATGNASPLKTIDDVLTEAKKRPILFGVTEVGAGTFVDAVITSSLLGIDAQFVAGFSGSRQTALAAMRGEVDLISFHVEPLLSLIETGDLRPLLRSSDERIVPHAALDTVPLLGGENGVAVRRAAKLGRDVETVKADVSTLIRLNGGGRLIAAPLGLEEGLFGCLEQRLYDSLTDTTLQAVAAQANYPLADVSRADVALADLKVLAEKAEKFIPIVRQAMEKARE